MNILIIAYDWIPRNVISTHRIYSFAKYWSKMGHKITVLTSKKKVFDKPLDLFLPRLKKVKVISIDNSNYTKYLGFLFLFSNFLRKVKFFFFNKLNYNFNLKYNWYKNASEYLKKSKNNFDIVVSSYGPEEAHLLGSDLKKNNKNIIWFADYRDLWSQFSIDSKTKRLELKTVGKYADCLTGVSVYIKKQINSFLNIPALSIYNGFDIDKAKIKKTFLKIKKNKKVLPLRIIYTGTLFNYRDPTPLFKVLFSLYKKGYFKYGEVVVEFYGERLSYLDKFLENNPAYLLFVKKMGHVSFAKSLSIQKKAGLLLLLESSLSHNKGNLTGKFFEYIFSGSPILLIGCEHKTEIVKLLKKTATGIAFSPKEYTKLENFLKEIITKNKLPNFYRPKVKNILEYSRKNQAEKMLFEMKKYYSYKNNTFIK
jgi:hypothetical protein